MGSGPTVRITVSRQVLLVQMTTTDLGCLCFLPEVRQLMARFPQLMKVNFLSSPTFIALSAPVVPFFLATTEESPVLCKLRRSLRAFLERDARP
ncbi:MAG: hypothetical protein ABS95_01665 [Verrucomicrobia bacterium SCN 57-15]|nr:MAG: hypothetical protein ABS95_01665 [Verrucomicrobia bacterium SCN 57-15]